MTRKTEAQIDPMFVDRWSPRAFTGKTLTKEQICSLFEAARWAPSCYNEQPWRFFYASDGEKKKEFLSALVERNRQWAIKAPVLIFLAAKRCFAGGNKENAWAGFDAGAAWMSLAFQARKMGLYAHAMAAFDPEQAYKVLNLDRKEYLVLAAIAVGWKGEASELPEDFRSMEAPNERKPLAEIISG